MFNKKIILVMILLISLLFISTVCATDNTTYDIVKTEEVENIELYNNIISIDEKTENNNYNPEILGSGEGSLTELKNEISKISSNGILTLNKDYKYSSGDSEIELSRPITINGNGHYIDGNLKTRIFKITAEGVTLNNIKFINAKALGADKEAGGAIFWQGNNGKLTNCIFKDNIGTDGGAIFWRGNYGTIENCQFSNNEAGAGGALYFGFTYSMGNGGYGGQIKNSTFKNNLATGQQGGGAIYGHIDIDNCYFEKNIANGIGDGGAINIVGTVSNSKFINNNVLYNGGAISGNPSTITNCYFSKNTADKCGGALYIVNMVDNCTFEDNEAGQYGGAIANSNDDTSAKKSLVLNSFFVNNKASYNGGALYRIGTTSWCTFKNNYANDYAGVIAGDGFDAVMANCNFKSNSARISSTSNNIVITNPKGTMDNYSFYWQNADIKLMSCSFNRLSSSFIVSDMNINYGENKNIQITLTDENNYGLSDKLITIKLTNNNEIKTFYEYTVQYGICEVDCSLNNLNSGDWDLTASFDGDEIYEPTSASSKITINPQTSNHSSGTGTENGNNNINSEKTNTNIQTITTPKTIKSTPKITAKAKTFKKSLKIKKYTVTLKTNKNKVMKNVKLYLKVNKKTYSAKTNSKGKATFKITKLTKKGAFKATITYKGNNNYNKVTKKVNIKCK